MKFDICYDMKNKRGYGTTLTSQRSRILIFTGTTVKTLHYKFTRIYNMLVEIFWFEIDQMIYIGPPGCVAKQIKTSVGLRLSLFLFRVKSSYEIVAGGGDALDKDFSFFPLKKKKKKRSFIFIFSWGRKELGQVGIHFKIPVWVLDFIRIVFRTT